MTHRWTGYGILVAAGIVFWSAPSQAEIILLSATLTAAQVVGTGSTSTGSGTAEVSVDTIAGTVTTDLSWTGMTGPVDRSHLHNGLEGEASPGNFFHELLDDSDRTISCGFPSSFSKCALATGSTHDVYTPSAGLLQLLGYDSFDELADDFEAEKIYVDVHTEAFGGGEIRGQLIPYEEIDSTDTELPDPEVPEPSSLALFGAALLGLAATGKLSVARQRRRAPAR